MSRDYAVIVVRLKPRTADRYDAREKCFTAAGLTRAQAETVRTKLTPYRGKRLWTSFEVRPVPRPQTSGHFVMISGRRAVCAACMKREQIDVEPPSVYVWEAGSCGWTGPVRCDACGRTIEVVIDGGA